MTGSAPGMAFSVLSGIPVATEGKGNGRRESFPVLRDYGLKRTQSTSMWLPLRMLT